MEPFIIHCTTCKARLKVQDASVIGDILACPKCSSMVHVVPPIGWKRSSGPQASLSESAVLPPESQILKVLPSKAKAAAVGPPLPARAAPAPRSAELESPVAAQSIAAVGPMRPAQPSSNAANTVSAGIIARIKQDWMFYSGGLAVGVLSGAAGLWLAVSAAKTAPPGPAGETPRAQTTLAQATPALSQTDPPANPRGETAALMPSTTDETVGPGSQSAPDETDDVAKPLATDPSGQSSDAATTPVQAAPIGEPAVAPRKGNAPALKLDPAPAAKPATHPAPDDAKTASSTAEVTAAADEPANTRPVAATDPTSADRRIGRSLTISEIEDRLSSTELPTVQFVDVPLAQFVEFINDLTALRITIDDRAITAVGKGRQSPLSVKLTNTTAGKALGAGLGSLGLTCVARDGKLVVTTKPPGAPE